jgi:Rieske Fe-S protein
MTGTIFTMTFAKYPQLQSGSAVAVSATGFSDAQCGLPNIIVWKDASSGKYVALSAGCNHACCVAKFETNQIRCPCHGATWDLTGKLTGSPASADLQNLPTCSDANGVYVTIG